MAINRITGDETVWSVLQAHPETFRVFRRHGCPDMRKGIYALSAHVMKVRWAARMHKIPAEVLVKDLNEVLEAHQGGEH